VRLTRYHLFLLGGLFLIFMGPLAFTQSGPERGGRDGKKGMNPDFMFMLMSGGNETFEVSKVQLKDRPGSTAEQQRERMLTFLQKKGVTNGVMTKAIFAEYSEERMAEWRKRETEKQQGGTPSAPGTTPPTPGTPAAPAQDPDAQGKAAFSSLDLDKNGSLNGEEMQAAAKRGSRIYDERQKWDTNKNGTIELAEYLEYYRSRNTLSIQIGQAAPPGPVKPIEEKRPSVYRTGKMPKELPAWFEEADKDKDGQVGLYEWKESGKSISEFLAMDLNGDGFITAEELLRHQRVVAKAADSSGPSLGSTYSAPVTPKSTSSEPDKPREKEKGGGRRFRFGR
jgi:hypothetical protein